MSPFKRNILSVLLASIRLDTLCNAWTVNPSASLFKRCPNPTHLQSKTSIQSQARTIEEDGIYRPFATYAWESLISSGVVHAEPASIPVDLARNEATLPGPANSRVNIEVKSLLDSKTGASEAIRSARYALLSTISGESSTPVTNAIHVLNLVIFPSLSLPNVPVFGADLVTLPGNKHLIVIDFQPVREGAVIAPEFEERLRDLHQTHVLDNAESLPWGGDIPPAAQRYFSPYALWTRLAGEDSVESVRTKVFDAFRDYLDLYIDMLKVSSQSVMEVETKMEEDTMEGHCDYLVYRSTNDPARPMLKRLYGEEWTERLINEVLFKPIR